MISIDDFQQLQRRVAAVKTRRDQAAGAAKQIEARLLAEFGVADAAAARVKLKKLEGREREMAAEYTEAKAAFEKKYGHLLEG